MTVRGLIGSLVVVCAAGLAQAEAPKTSLVPHPRPDMVVATNAPPVLRPMARPTTAQIIAAPGKPRITLTGSVCDNSGIKGTMLDPITSRIKGCSVPQPVLVTSVGGVRLSPAATINCQAAVALAKWIDQGLQPAFQKQVVQLNIADSYSCRPRNNVRGAKVSEHGSGNAIDIQGFVLQSGKSLSVIANYGRQMRVAQKAACGTFATTLGPGSDGYHEDHIHFDVSRRGGRPYCR